MKITSICEKEFIKNCIAKSCRIDGRSLSEGRSLEIIFGEEWGCCIVSLGNTKVLAQVSAEITEPKSVSPMEGALHVNLEMSSMSTPDVQTQSRISDELLVCNRHLERCVRDSKCIDLESLCIVANSKVWTIRVNITALNDDGNLTECGSIAAISALAHFKRPDVTVLGTEVSVHSLEDREPVPLNLHHLPININLAVFNEGEQIVVDPLEIEERIAEGCYIIGMNAHQEICSVTRRGVILLSSDTIRKCRDYATRRSQEVTQIIRSALDDDAYKRATNSAVGFVNMIQSGTILGAKQPIKKYDFHKIAQQVEEDEGTSSELIDMTSEEVPSSKVQTRTMTPKISETRIRVAKFLKEVESSIFEGGASKWNNLEEEDDDESSGEEMPTKNNEIEPSVKKEINNTSEDESVHVVVDELEVKPMPTRTWYSKDPFA